MVYRFIKAMVRLSTWVSAIAVVIMMMVTVSDVALRTFFNSPIRGNVEMVQFLLVCFVYFGLPEVFFRLGHITVDAIDGLIGPRVLQALKLIGATASFCLIALMLWRMVPEAIDTYEFGGVTLDLNMRYFWYWIPILAGCAISIIAAAAALAFLFGARKTEDLKNGS